MLSLAAVLPLLFSGGWVASYYAQQARANIRHMASDTVERVAQRLADELSGQLQVAEALAASTALDNGNLEAFRQAAARVLAFRPRWQSIELTTPSGAEVLRMPSAEIATLGPIADRPLVTLRVPVLRAGTLRYVLSFSMAPDSVATILKTAGAPTDWIGVVVDASGHIIARILGGGLQFGKRAGDTLRAAMARAPAGTYAGRSLEGVRVETVYRALPSTMGWTVAFAIPLRLLEAPVRRALYILAGVGGAGLALAALLAALVAHDLAQRRRDERALATRALAASEQRRALALDAANLGTWRWEIAPDRFDGSPRCRDLLGLAPDALRQSAETWQHATTYVHPHDCPVLQTAIRRCCHGLALECEFRVVDAAGQVRWVRMDGRLQEGGFDGPRSLQGVIADISALRRAQAERLALQRRLAQAQEEERRRISRELHDQVGQTVTGLSLGLKAMEESLAERPSHPAMRARLHWLRSLTAEIGREIHRTASDLRPAALDDFGLHRAVETLAARWSERYCVNVDVQTVGPIGRMSPEVETTVFRIIQEALNNVLKHARAHNVSVVLKQADEQLRVIVEDDGVGFYPDQVGQSGASPPLGLSGIRERLNLVGGTMGIESAPGSGTTLFVQVPAQPAAPGPLACRRSACCWRMIIPWCLPGSEPCCSQPPT